MNFIDYIAFNDYTDEKNYELIVRVFADKFSFGWYRNADTKQTISDSQFDTGSIDPDRAEDMIQEKFGCYQVGRL